MSLEINIVTIVGASIAATISVVSAVVSWIKFKLKRARINITLEMPDGAKFESKKISSKTKIQDLINEFVDSGAYPIINKSTKTIVVDYILKNGVSERLNPDKTLNDYDIYSGETLRVYPEAKAGCFPGDTLITMENGEKKLIKELKIGEKVLSFNHILSLQTEDNLSSEVENIFKGKSSSILDINNKLRITDSHLVLSNGNWCRAKDLKIGDLLYDENGSNIQIRKIELIEIELEIFNLFLSSRNAPFFANGIIVQNMLGGPKEMAKAMAISNVAEPFAPADFQG